MLPPGLVTLYGTATLSYCTPSKTTVLGALIACSMMVRLTIPLGTLKPMVCPTVAGDLWSST